MNSRRHTITALAAWTVAAGLPAGPAQAQKRYDPGASDTEIRIGQTWALSGPVAGESYQAKVHAAYFQSINDKGGVRGRKLRLITLDDGYLPPKTMEQTRRLVEQDEVLFIAMPFGTPTNAATQRYLNGLRIPQLFVLSGGTRFFDGKTSPWSTGALPSYEKEGAIYGRHVLQLADDPASGLGMPKIGILWQNDDFGRDFVKGVKAGLGARAGSLIVHEASYEPSEPTVDSQLIALKGSGANVLMNFSAGRAASQSIRKVHELGWKPLHILDSPWATIESVLKPVGIEKSTGIVTATYLKEPSDPAWAGDPELKTYLEFMKAYAPDVNPFARNSAMAYMLAGLVVKVIEQAGDDLTRANILRQATSLTRVVSPVLLPGTTISVSDAQRNPVNRFQLVRFDGERWVPVGKPIEE